MRCQSNRWGFHSTRSTISTSVCCLVMVKSCCRRTGLSTSQLMHCRGANTHGCYRLGARCLWLFTVLEVYRKEREGIKGEANREGELHKRGWQSAGPLCVPLKGGSAPLEGILELLKMCHPSPQKLSKWSQRCVRDAGLFMCLICLQWVLTLWVDLIMLCMFWNLHKQQALNSCQCFLLWLTHGQDDIVYQCLFFK